MFLGWVLVHGLVACSGSEPEIPPPNPNVEIEALCTEVAAADCARITACGTARAPFTALADCTARQAAFLCDGFAEAIQGGLTASSLEYFSLAAGTCRDAVGNLDCSIGYDHRLLDLEACRAVFNGTGVDGDLCHFPESCTGDTFCRVANECPGNCAPVLASNAACQVGDRCLVGLYCDATARRCVPSAGLGATCGLSISGAACLKGGWCDRSNPASPVCQAAKGRGSGCASDSECAGTARCILNTCADGQPNDRCQDNLDCDANLRCVNTRCAELADLDEDCVTTPCGAGLTCTGTQGQTLCRPAKKSGSCATDAECFLGFCDADMNCQPSLESGVACERSEQCLPGHECDMACKPIAPRCGG